jgi:hypothetical protein
MKLATYRHLVSNLTINIAALLLLPFDCVAGTVTTFLFLLSHGYGPRAGLKVVETGGFFLEGTLLKLGHNGQVLNKWVKFEVSQTYFMIVEFLTSRGKVAQFVA